MLIFSNRYILQCQVLPKLTVRLKVAQLCLNSLQPHGQQLARLLCPWNYPGKSTEVGSRSFSRTSSQPRDRAQVFSLARWILFTVWATREAHSQKKKNQTTTEIQTYAKIYTCWCQNKVYMLKISFVQDNAKYVIITDILMLGGYKFSRRHTAWTDQESKPQLVRLMKYQGKLRFLTLNCPQGLPCSPVVKISLSNAGGEGSIPGRELKSHMPQGQKTKA